MLVIGVEVEHMSDYKPTEYHKDPMVNAVLNVACQIAALAHATDGLLYGLKYSKTTGMSVAESLETGLENLSIKVGGVIDAIQETRRTEE